MVSIDCDNDRGPPAWLLLIMPAQHLDSPAPHAHHGFRSQRILSANSSRAPASHGFAFPARLRLPASGQTKHQGNSPTVSIATHSPVLIHIFFRRRIISHLSRDHPSKGRVFARFAVSVPGCVG